MRLISFLFPAAMGLALMGAKCEQEISFPETHPEICSNQLDDDEDGKVDCSDSDCREACRPSVTLDPPFSPTYSDSQTLSGTQSHVRLISVSTVPPLEISNSVTLTANGWKVLLQGMEVGTYALTIIGTDSLDSRDTARGQIEILAPKLTEKTDTVGTDTLP
jgi:hypothetical protein